LPFFENISSEPFKDRATAMRQSNECDEVLYYMLEGEERFLEWAHSAGIVIDPQLRALSPPVPPHELRSIVAAPSEPVFLWTGAYDAKHFHGMFQTYWRGSSERPRVLDFGCGCGRMTRFLGQHPNLSVQGSDINTGLVEWCRANLDDVETSENGALPPLDRQTGSVDFLYSLSIFTHLSETAMKAWLSEIARVLDREGIAVITTHGHAALDIIASSEQHQSMFRVNPAEVAEIKSNLASTGYKYLRYDVDVLAAADAGDDYGNSFADHDFIRREWPKAGLEVVDILPGGLRGWQDAIILRKVA
jgi:SAM-dependent methyltransferase